MSHPCSQHSNQLLSTLLVQRTKMNILSTKASNIEEKGQSRPKKSNKRNSEEIEIMQSENI